MVLDNKDKVDCLYIEPPKSDIKAKTSKAMSFPRKHKQIKKAKNKGIALVSDIQNKE